MTKDVSGWELADAIADPKSMFSHPNEIVRMKQLFRRDKLAILNSWKDLEEQEAQSRDSDDHDDAQNMLREVEEAIRQLG